MLLYKIMCYIYKDIIKCHVMNNYIAFECNQSHYSNQLLCWYSHSVQYIFRFLQTALESRENALNLHWEKNNI